MTDDMVKHEGPGWLMLDAHGGEAGAREASRVLPLLAHIGMPWVGRREGREDWFGWNGKALRLNEPVGDLLHEVGHWICAHPRLRHRANFGLESKVYLRHGPAQHSDDEEAMASLLGILLERALGQPWADTFNGHNWRARDFGGGLSETLAMLRQAGLISDMTPIAVRPLPRLPTNTEDANP